MMQKSETHTLLRDRARSRSNPQSSTSSSRAVALAVPLASSLPLYIFLDYTTKKRNKTLPGGFLPGRCGDVRPLATAMPFLSGRSSSSSSDPPTPPAPARSSATASAASEEAERRLREAELRLKEAIEELQRHHAHRGGADGGGGGHPECDHADESCVAHAIGNLCQSFLLSYGVRVGIGILLRAFKLARRQSYSSLLDLKVLHPSLFSHRCVHLCRCRTDHE